jgi:putative serine protease PepD
MRGMPKLMATIIVLVGAAAFAAGCGSGSDSNGTSAEPVTASSAQTVLQQDYVNVVKKVSPSVVQIETTEGLGSGVVFDRRGDVVTNAHVVDRASRFLVTLASGHRYSATIVGRDVGNDLAVIRLSGSRPAPATFADSSQVEVGDIALAIGNPLGLRTSVTQGIVSAVGRSVSEGDGVTLSSAIQTSAEINPGNSGGALVDIFGRVIGIPTLAALDPQLGGSQAPGIGFAISSSAVSRVASRLIGSG